MKLNLKKKFIIIFIGTVFLPQALIFSGVAWYLRDTLMDQEQEQLLSSIEIKKYELIAFLEGAAADIGYLSTDMLYADPEIPAEDKLAHLQNFIANHPDYHDITIFNRDGNAMVSSSYDYRISWQDNPLFNKALEGRTVISDVVIFPEPFGMALYLLAPVKNGDGDIESVMAITMDMTGIWEIIDRPTPWESGFYFLRDTHGRFVAHPDKDMLLEQGEPTNDFNYLTESIDITATEEQGRFQWELGIVIDENEVVASANIFIMVVFTIFLLGIVLAFVLTSIFTRPMVKNIKKMNESLKRIAGGEYSLKTDVRSSDEIGELAQEVDKTGAELEKAQAELNRYSRNLEKEVGKRTKQLEEKIDQLERMQKVMIGREKRIIELKEELKELRNK
ncbi:HAMP domain-containing protein [Patescibacteria group bacterium]|nr:HAMP domain-containing protein [Patescibacteria group bacterium]MBU1673273.1 HAMP domain-containing protein [Patescibacteria group bacterium]MBU1964081.1 HAMP domain-containing protein [Patescibacteria group bacterium]